MRIGSRSVGVGELFAGFNDAGTNELARDW